MKPTHLLTLLGVFAAASVSQAGALNPSQVSADAKWLLHYDADAAKSSEVGEHLMDKMSDLDERRLRAVKRLLSINPVEDVKSITLYGTSARPEDAVLVVRVDHDADHVADLIAAAPNYSSESIGNSVMHKLECGRGHAAHIVLVDDKYLVASATPGAARSAVGLISGKGKGMDKVDVAKGQMFVAWANIKELEMRGRSKMAKEVTSVKYSFGEKGDSIGWHMALGMSNEATAKMVKSMADGMLEYAKKQKKADNEFMQKAMAAINIKVDGSNVHVSAFYKNDELIDFLDMVEEKMKNYKKGSGCPLGFGRKGSCCGKCGGEKGKCCGKCGGEKGKCCGKCKGSGDKDDDKHHHHHGKGDHDHDHGKSHHHKDDDDDDDDRRHHHHRRGDDDDDDDDKKPYQRRRT